MRIGLHLTTYNRILFTEQCLRSIIWSEPKFSKIVIVDNNSTDGTRSLITEYFMEKFPIIEKTIFNAENRHLGAAVVQGWNYLKDDCDVLGWINNDFLFEPGWEENLIDCFTEFNLDYIVGTVRPDREKNKFETQSRKGKYTTTDDVGAAYFLKTEHFLNGVAPSTKPFSKEYVGPGPAFHKQLKKNKLKGVRLAHPGVLVRDSEYTKPENIKYYDETFGIRGRENKLEKWRKQENSGNPRGWTNWDKFKQKYYPDKEKIEKIEKLLRR